MRPSEQTAVVINAGIGDLTFGLTEAGFQVVAAYEADSRARKIHVTNFATPIYPFSLEYDNTDYSSFPKADLLAVRLHLPYIIKTSGNGRTVFPASVLADRLQKLIFHCEARSFFFLINASSAQGNTLTDFWEILSEQMKYSCKFSWQSIDVAQATGFPVHERMVCGVGTLDAALPAFRFPNFSYSPPRPVEQYLQMDLSASSWYFNLNPNKVPRHEDGHSLYCWQVGGYRGAELVHWNYVKLPIVETPSGMRRISHQEMAMLKGFPKSYLLPTKIKNKHALYKQLQYAGNVLVVQQITRKLLQHINGDPWEDRPVNRAEQLESIFGSYLESILPANQVLQGARIEKIPVDFRVLHDNKVIYFETKSYSNNYAPTDQVCRACKQLSEFSKDGQFILVVANIVLQQIKEQCHKQYGVFIWDVSNLLWLYDGFADIKSKFIASLNYSVEEIQPSIPIPNLFAQEPSPKSAGKEQKLSWEARFAQVRPGKDHFQEYENLCTELLQDALGDYLTLWARQSPSNDGLYRFDLCCKIKAGVNHDFFDTIMHYFNTKYIVFEFKNYTEEITQGEIYTTEKYLYEKALRKVAIIVSRHGASEHAVQAAKGSLRETGKLILCLSDDSLLEMVNRKVNGESEPADNKAIFWTSF